MSDMVYYDWYVRKMLQALYRYNGEKMAKIVDDEVSKNIFGRHKRKK